MPQLFDLTLFSQIVFKLAITVVMNFLGFDLCAALATITALLIEMLVILSVVREPHQALVLTCAGLQTADMTFTRQCQMESNLIGRTARWTSLPNTRRASQPSR